MISDININFPSVGFKPGDEKVYLNILDHPLQVSSRKIQ
jgi:hypothetical protein